MKVLECAKKTTGMPAVLVISMVRLYEVAKTKVRMENELSEELEIEV